MACPYLNWEINRTASFLNVATFLLTCTALAQPNWFRIHSGYCQPYLSLTQFVGSDGLEEPEYVSPSFKFSTGGFTVDLPSIMHHGQTCVTQKVTNLLRVLIMLCFLTMASSMCGVLINLSPSNYHFVKVMRKNAISSILCVFWVIAIIAICYYVTVLLEMEAYRLSREIISVTYDYGFYTITVAGVFALLATAANHWIELVPRRDTQSLVEDWEISETSAMDRPSSPVLPPYSARPPSFVPRFVRQDRSAGNHRQALRTNIDTYHPFDDLSVAPPPPPYTP